MSQFLYLGSTMRVRSLKVGDRIYVIGGPQKYISFRNARLGKVTWDEGILYSFRVKRLKYGANCVESCGDGPFYKS